MPSQIRLGGGSNLTGQIGWKSTEIMTTKFDQAGIQCNLNEFLPNLTSN